MESLSESLRGNLLLKNRYPEKKNGLPDLVKRYPENKNGLPDSVKNFGTIFKNKNDRIVQDIKNIVPQINESGFRLFGVLWCFICVTS